MKSRGFIAFLVFRTFLAHGQEKDTFEVYFPFNKTELTTEAKDHIDKLVFNDTLVHGNKLTIFGYADYVGGNAHNDTLSRRRAKAVKDYLATMGFDRDDITLCIGKGKIERSGMKGRDGYATDRKVQIVITRVAAPPPPVQPPKETKPAPAKPTPKPDISKMKVNESFAITDINFAPGSPEILPQSFPALNMLLGYMQQYPTLKIRIEGHVCCIGPTIGDSPGTVPDFPLSGERAVAIRHYLVVHGISKDRMEAIGLGNRNPVVPADLTEEDHIKNRRVEIRILSK